MTRDEGRPESGLRGRLAEIFLPSLLGNELDELLVRLGDRASIAFPWSKAIIGLALLRTELEKETALLKKYAATYEHDRTVLGHDRDVAEGRLNLNSGGTASVLNVAVLCVRRPAREVDVRVFLAAEGLGRESLGVAGKNDDAPSIASDVSTHLGAIRFGDPAQILETFESEARLVDPFGKIHDRASGALGKFYSERLPIPEGATTWAPAVRGVADTGRVAAIEYETAGTGKLGLLVLERGESGLFREARLYDSIK